MILLTGASGCIGSYLLEELLDNTPNHVIAWVRSPEKLHIRSHSRLKIWTGGLENSDDYKQELKQITQFIHVATVWGGMETFEINDRQTARILSYLDPQICEHIHLFSTASLLNSQHRFWPQSLRLGTDYIRSKASLFQKLKARPNNEIPISWYFPTVVFGGDSNHSYSAVSQSLPDLSHWIKLLSHIKTQGYIHSIHARDIARMIVFRIENKLAAQDLVLGNSATSINELIDLLRQTQGLHPKKHQVNLDYLLPPLIWSLQKTMSDWDRFSLKQRLTRYQSINAQNYDLALDLASTELCIKDCLKNQKSP